MEIPVFVQRKKFMLTGRRYSSFFSRACKKILAVDLELSTFYHLGVVEIF